ncbi:hypothetical protein [Ferruginibacter sp. SUN106]|uniref:hypothetical protein n=1 Tax=Ferruginibacter sp. SUN106 TaxID=2978348 RepID=UPI003D36E168
MSTVQEKIDQLIAFRDRDKFSTEAWNNRGLNPSDEDICKKLKTLFYYTANNLIESVEAGAPVSKLKSVLKQRLATFNKWHYDTEEKEFICDLFHELAIITEVDFKRSLNNWLYGTPLMIMLNIIRFIKPERVLETFKYNCTGCKAAFELRILKKDAVNSTQSWAIGRCGNCREFNLISYGPGIKNSQFINYQPEEFLQKNDHTYEQALIRLEQLKFFRK